MEIFAVNTLLGFVPMSSEDAEEVEKLTLGQAYKVKVSTPRNIKFHRKFFLLMKLVYENQEQYNSMEYMRKEIIKAAGFFNTYIGIDGFEVYEAKSIKFGKMSEVEFSELYERVLDVIVKYFGHEKENLVNEIEQYF